MPYRQLVQQFQNRYWRLVDATSLSISRRVPGAVNLDGEMTVS